MTPTRGVSLSLLCALGVFAGSPAGAADPPATAAAAPPVADRPDAAAVLAAMIESRESLRSGRLTAAGPYWRTDPRRTAETTIGILLLNKRGPVEVSVAFDHDAGRTRFLIDRPSVFDTAGDDRGPFGRSAARILRTPDVAYRWADDLGRTPDRREDVVALPPDYEEKLYHEWEPRLIGLRGCLEMSKFPPATLEEYRETLLTPDRVVGARWAAPSVAVVDLADAPDAPVLTRLFVDTARGHSPVRVEYRDRSGAADRLAGWTDTVWAERDGVWVPAATSDVSVSGEGGHESLQLEFAWSAVNEPPAADLFTPASLDLPADTPVADGRPGPPKVDGTVGAVGFPFPPAPR